MANASQMIGKTAAFDTHGGDSQLNERAGSKVFVVRPLTEAEADISDVGNMYRIRFDDGFETDAFEDELTVLDEEAANVQEKGEIFMEKTFIIDAFDLDNTSEPLFFPRLSSGVVVSNDFIVSVLKKLDELYGNTDQDLIDWASEYQLWSRMLFARTSGEMSLLLNHQFIKREAVYDMVRALIAAGSPYSKELQTYLFLTEHLGGIKAAYEDSEGDCYFSYSVDIPEAENSASAQCPMLTEDEKISFNKLFSKYCRQEVALGHCEPDSCEFCPVDKAHEEIFVTFANDEDVEDED